MSHYIETTVTPIFKSPRGRPDRWTMAALRQHLQTALLLELYTIPPYLFAMYSIDTDKVPGNEKEEEVKAVQAFRHIVGQEMLHLALVGNLITAVRGRPQLYGEPYVPKYPSEILYEGVLLTLAPASQEQIQNFVELEQPSDEKEPSNGLPEVTSVLEGYKSIGDFYNNLKESLKELHGREEIGDAMFDKTSIDKQWKKGDFFEDVAVIDNLETALDKLTLIIEQGEGGSVGSQNIPGESHYEVFQRLVEKKLSVHKLVHDPKTARFEGKEKLYPVCQNYVETAVRENSLFKKGYVSMRCSRM
ncbi:ferritin-like-domain-containing protein [Rhizoctonia solani]|nr:ferritin-like-domain-containing protein [Rhizoctonia solani]